MKRLHRKVQNSQESTTPSPSRTFTFDRRAFLECSSRMKRIVPTLGRSENKDSAIRQLSQGTGLRVDASTTDNEDEALEEKQDATMAAPLDVNGTGESGEDTTDYGVRAKLDTESSSGLLLERESRSHVGLDVNEMGIFSRTALTLPKNTEQNKSASAVSGKGNEQLSSATLPASFAPSKPSSRRQIWMKPLTNFVAFMSHIGNNIHITSYPQ